MYSAAKNYTVAETYSEAGILLTSGKTHGEVATTCPQCSASRKQGHQTIKCLNINLTTGKWKCHHCDWAGRLKDEADRMAEDRRASVHKTYALPTLANHTGLSDRVVAYFEGRKISRRTLADFRIVEAEEWMPKAQKPVTTIQFPYFREGQCVNIKYRGPGKDFKMAKDAERILFNLDQALAAIEEPEYQKKYGRSLILVEGEPDCMTWWEAGFRHVVSVPNGAQLSLVEKQQFELTGQFNDANAQNLEYLDNCWHLLQHIDTFYIAGDTDAAGLKLRRELIRRFGPESCKSITYQGCKDANDLAQKVSVLALDECYQRATGIPVDGIHTVEGERDAILDYLDNGVPPGLPVGIQEFEGFFSFIVPQLVAMTGVPGDGKSTVMYFLMALTSIRYNWKWLVYSPENYPIAKLFVRLAGIIAGLHPNAARQSPEARQKLVDAIDHHIGSHFYLINPQKARSHADIQRIARACVKRFGINGLCLDPFNDVPQKDRKGLDITEYVTMTLSDYRELNVETGIATWILAHPKTMDKPEGATAHRVAQANDIFGGGAWWNRVDSLICVHRKYELDDDKLTDIHIHKFKEHDRGGKPTKQFPVSLEFEECGRFHGASSGTTIADFADTLPARQGFREPAAMQPAKPFATAGPSEFDDYPVEPTQPLPGGYSDNPDDYDDDPPF